VRLKYEELRMKRCESLQIGKKERRGKKGKKRMNGKNEM
jgi:hypothetical protein